MRGAGPISFIVLVLASGCWGSTTPEPPATPAAQAEAAPGGVPRWVPAPTPEQQALLTPSDRAVKEPALRVFPALDRFAYAPNRPLADPEDAVKFTRMVTQVLNDSPRFYALHDAPASAQNLVAQYGPEPGEPDGFQIVRRVEGGLGELVPAPGAEEARAALAQGAELAASGDRPGAIAAYRAGIDKSPGVPALRVALARALLDAGKSADAEGAYRGAVGVDPTFAPAQIALAELAERRNDLPAARRALGDGLAYHPADERGQALARRLSGGALPGKPAPSDGGWLDTPAPAARPGGAARATPFALFLDVDARGVVHVATPRGDAAQIYGGCRAVMRYEPELRVQLFHESRETPYYLSVREEVVCLEAALGAYLAGRSNGGTPVDPALEDLLRTAREEGLSAYAMFEILGQRRPERARAAPAEVHRELVAYVERHLLGRKQAIPDGSYTAER
jgi:hypothetical protein